MSRLPWRLADIMRSARGGRGLEAERRERLIDRLLLESPTAEFIHVVLIMVVAILFWNNVSQALLLAWVTAVVVVALARALVRRRLAFTRPAPEAAISQIRTLVLLSAVAWAAGPVFLAGRLGIAELALVIVVFAGLVAGATSTLLADPESFYYFLGGTLGPLAVAVLLSGQTRAHYGAVLLVLLFGATKVVTFRRSHVQLLRHLTALHQLRINEDEANRGRGFLEALLAAAPNAIATLDSDGRVLGINPAFERLFGFPEDEVTGGFLTDLIVPETERESAEALDRQVHANQVVVADVRRVTKEGKTIWVQASAAQVREEVGRGAWFVMYDDITARKRLAEERLRAKEAAEEAAHTKAVFLASMSHEIRTPMNGVLGMLEMLRDTDLDDYQRETVDVAAASADSLLGILNDILDVSKIEAGQLELEEIPFDVQEAVTQAARVLTIRASERGNELLVDIGPEMPPLVVGDPGRLRQVVTNLLSNAVKFTEDGEVVVALSLEGRTDGRAHIKISVRDTGVGIPADRLDSIFGEFTQADATINRTHGGTGLGLAIARSLVEKMGGRLEVTSEEGEGSEFRFVIPFQEASGGGGGSDRGHGTRGTQRKALPRR